ncbi:MlaD family protein [Desulfolithobacter sp.]
MSKKASPTLIGTFVIGALFLLVAGIFIIGNIKLREQTNRFVLFFNGSLNGLDTGAPVTYKGVPVGHVAGIEILYDKNTGEYLTPVYVEITVRDSSGKSYFEEAGFKDAGSFFQAQIERGLRAKLKMQSLVTGKLYIELSYFPGTETRLRKTEGSCMEIPTVPSELERLTQALENLHLEEIIGKTVSILDNINSILTSSAFHEGMATFNTTLKDLDILLKDLDRELPRISSGLNLALDRFATLAKNTDTLVQSTTRNTDLLGRQLQESLNNADKTMASLETTLKILQEVLSEDSPLFFTLTRTVDEISRTSSSVRQFIDYLQRHPNALIATPREETR